MRSPERPLDPQCHVQWLSFTADHPALPGHFPGRPLIPGVVILERIHALLRQCRPTCRLQRLPNVKFLRPVLPDESLLLGIELTHTDPQSVQGRFWCRCANQPVAQGNFVALDVTS